MNNAVSWHIDKSTLPLSEPRRYRDRAHLKFVAAQPCLVCGRAPRTRITCGSCNRAPWGVGSAMSLRSRYAEPIIAPSIGEATRRHGGCRSISTPWLLRKGSGTRPAFTVPPRMETWTYRPARQPFNRRKMTVSDRPRDRPTNDIVETI